MATLLLAAVLAILGSQILAGEIGRGLAAESSLSHSQRPIIRSCGRYQALGCRGKCMQRMARRKEVMTSRSRVAHRVSTPETVSRVAPMGTKSSKNAPTHEEICQRAFEIHIQRGAMHGCDLDDWLQAERELQEKYKMAK